MDREIMKNFCYLLSDIANSPELKALSPSTTRPSAIQYSSFVLSIVTCCIGLIANIIVILATGFLMKKNKYKIWFLNLALADFIFLLFLPLYGASVLRAKWPYGSNMCKFYNFLSFVNTYASIYILTALNIDRALSVAKPLWHKAFHSRTFCLYMCALIWVLSLLCSIPAIIYSDIGGEGICTLSRYDTTYFAYKAGAIQVAPFYPREFCNAHLTDPEYVKVWSEVTFTAMRLVVPLAVLGFVVPLCIILVCNVIVVIVLYIKNSKTMTSSTPYRVVILSVLSFFCARTPYVLSYIIFLVSVHTMKMTLMYKLSIILPLLFTIAATSSLLNPLVNVFIGKQVRSEIKDFFRKKSICVPKS
ncbi:chemerin-like receptor 1 [Leptodactylus fuscus]|uniref:chemerin-like receptor 1 n=1 Tax=Leptodactylus fuscus TaxID=238119 RepID=UPI003F4E8D31